MGFKLLYLSPDGITVSCLTHKPGKPDNPLVITVTADTLTCSEIQPQHSLNLILQVACFQNKTRY